MKRLLLVLLALVLVGSVASAQMMAKSGMWGIQTSLGFATSTTLAAPTIGAKFLVSDDIAIRFEAGITSASVTGGAGSTTGYAVGGAFEYHLTGGKGNVSPYVGLGVGFGGSSLPGGGTAPTSLTVGGFFGGEYFFSTNFSAAGQIGVGFNSTGISGATTTTISTGSMNATSTAAIIWTWYIN